MKKANLFMLTGLLFLAFAIFLFLACKKTDDTVASPLPEQRFFNLQASVPDVVKKIAKVIQKQNREHSFISTLVRNEGYVLWDKSEIYTDQTSTDTIVLLPMVLENDRKVNSFLACRINGEKLTIFMHRGRRYSLYDFTDNNQSITAKSLALQFMYLNKKVFGDSVFVINDTKLFSNSGKKKVIKIFPEKVGAETNRTNTWIFFNVERCYYIGDDGDQGQVVSVEPGGSNNYSTSEWFCLTTVVQVFLPDYGGGGGYATVDPTSGGGGGGGGTNPATVYFWWNNDPCPDPNGPQVPDAPQCNGGTVLGWQPLYPIFKVNNITTDFSNPCIVAAKDKFPNHMLTIFAVELLIQTEINEDWTISFSENPNLFYPGTTDPMLAESYPTSSTNTWNVVLNPKFWEQATYPNATQEMAGVTILHEIIHGCIFVYKQKYGLTTLNDFTTHEVMFKNFIFIFRQALMNAFGLTETDATALALTGLDDVLQKEYAANGTLTSYNQQYYQFAFENYQITIPIADAIADEYFVQGTKGVRCF